jgi:hypothetical protein
MSILQQNWRKGQNIFCLEGRGVGERERVGGGGRNGPSNACTYELMSFKGREERKSIVCDSHVIRQGRYGIVIMGWVWGDWQMKTIFKLF